MEGPVTNRLTRRRPDLEHFDATSIVVLRPGTRKRPGALRRHG